MKKMMDSTTVIITTTDNRVLLQKRDENPDIEYSGCYSLVSGYLEEEETPLDGIIRELKEEFEHKKSQKVHFSSITYLGSEYRADYDRWEYIHHTYLMDDAADIRILEGESFVLLDMDECLRLENLAPHHKLFLLKYRAGLCKIDVREQSKKMFDEITVRDLIKVESVGDMKNYSLLEAGTGFVIGEDTTLSASIPAVEAAKYIGFLQFVPKVLRGNHYHFRKVEYMLILQGRMHATFQKYDDSEAVIEEIWEKGDLVRTLPGCVHTLTALGESNVLTVEFSPQPYVARDVLMNDKK